ncbi:aminoacetone oxidase family FAD-binding enzyme [Pikeienuella piscinae]|uniref:Aminoacetone oxidase family FAD-binding enzyme n=1 Tax=Pikeienuella piscinae TaxID=2748098 RepID=A0A7L5BWC3_9RHOB|nr:aminoacetone oxidase family FAD-binding enzyme [Pikeienuella piscinae]QIE55741.1 aminoacetone oxidase family FAD-binding enzyme [Pikeienuella piscinae]
MTEWDVVVLGAGAAGLFAGAEAARRGRRVLVLDHAAKPAEKIRISGGGRCNFTNLHSRPEAFLSENPRFAVSALTRYDQHDFIRLVEAHGIGWHEKTLGQLFCDGRSGAIIEMLLSELGDAGGALRLSEPVERVERAEDGFRLVTSRGVTDCAALIVATGGKSIPKMGATGFAYDLARQFGLDVTETRPALVPFTLGPELLARLKPLVGVAAEVEATAGAGWFKEAMLFTHRGLSGPALLQVSSYWREGEALRIAFGGGDEVFGALRAARAEAGRRALRTALAAFLPKALADWLEAEIGERRNLADLSDRRLREIAGFIAGWEVRPVGTEGYRTAEVTLGGISTAGLDGRTMAAKAVPGLHFIGEAVDVTGWLGGYNFQWAWSSGFAAGGAV